MKKIVFGLLILCGVTTAKAQSGKVVKEATIIEVSTGHVWSDASGHFDLWEGDTEANPGNSNGNAVAHYVVAQVSGTGELISGMVRGNAGDVSVGARVRSITDGRKSMLSLIR